MKRSILLLCLLFSCSYSMIYRISPSYDYEELLEADPVEAARLSWLFIRGRRVESLGVHGQHRLMTEGGVVINGASHNHANSVPSMTLLDRTSGNREN